MAGTLTPRRIAQGVVTCLAMALVLPLAANPQQLFQKAKAADLAGKAVEARQLWRSFLAAEAEGPRADRVRHRLVVLETKDMSRDCRHYPVWSPDGQWLMHGYGGLAIVDIATGEGVSMESPTEGMYNHDWGPDGVTISCRQKLDNGRHSVFLYERQPDEALYPAGDGGAICEGIGGKFDSTGENLLISAAAKQFGARRVAVGIARYELASKRLLPLRWKHAERPARNQASWAGKDTYVFHAFGPTTKNDRAVFVARMSDGGGIKQLTDNGADNRTPAVAPDGRRIAYSRFKQGEPEVVCIALTNGSLKPIVLGPGRQPCWSPDGSWLAYDSPQGIKLLRFGGVSACLFVATGQWQGDTVTLTITSDAKVHQTLRVSCQVYDERSVRLADWSWQDDPLSVPPEEYLSSDYSIPPELLETAASLRFRIEPDSGPATVILVKAKPADRKE